MMVSGWWVAPCFVLGALFWVQTFHLLGVL